MSDETSHETATKGRSCRDGLQKCFDCHPKGRFERILTYGILAILSWSVPWAIVGEDCLPGGNIFSLVVLIDCCMLAGFLVGLISIPKIPPLPPLLGMLVCGFCLRNIPVINVATDINPDWSSALRSIALSVILVKAGLDLDATALKKMKGVCFRLTLAPCIVETATCAVMSNLLLGFPWEWGILLGFVLGAVTPAIIVPSLLYLQRLGFGVQSGIPTLVIASSSFDDVFAITGFSVTLAIAFSQGGLGLVILRGIGEVLAGIVIGILIGIIQRFLPGAALRTTDRERFIAVVAFGVSVHLGSKQIGFPGAGAMAAIVQAFVAALSWGERKDVVSARVGTAWNLFEPVLFGLIGAEVSVDQLSSQPIGLSCIVLLVGLCTRSAATFLAVSRAGFTTKEKLFICLAWLPKATVQAAIGSVALDNVADSTGGDQELYKQLAMQVLTISVLSILITAPIGAACIGMTGPLLLKKDNGSEDREQELEVINDGSSSKFLDQQSDVEQLN